MRTSITRSSGKIYKNDDAGVASECGCRPKGSRYTAEGRNIVARKNYEGGLSVRRLGSGARLPDGGGRWSRVISERNRAQ